SNISRARRPSSARPLRLVARWLNSMRSASVSSIVLFMSTIILPFYALQPTSSLLTLRWREPDSNHRSLRQVNTPTSRILSERLRCAPAGCGPVGPYWPRNVLERLIAEVFEGQVEFARGIFLDSRRNADSARFCQAFKTGGDVGHHHQRCPRPRPP